MSMMKMEGGRVAESVQVIYQISQGLRPSKLTSGAGVLKQLNHGDTTAGGEFMAASSNQIPADGDTFYFYIYCTGDERKMLLSTLAAAAHPTFDLYVNGVVDSSAYDDYAAAETLMNRWITLTRKIKKGYNEIKLKVNGKNVASTNYYMTIFGLSVQ